MKVSRLDVSLGQYEVGISGAVPDRRDWSEEAMDRGILEFVALLSGLVLKYGGRIVHGSHPTFTPIILRQARQHASNRSRKPVTLVMSQLWAADLTEDDIGGLSDVAELVITKKIGDGSAEDPGTRNGSLSAMRRVLIDAQNVMVAVGGKMHEGDGVIPGVGEEMKLASEKGIPRFLVAGLGGFASKLAAQLTPDSLGNTLSHAQNVELFGSDDVANTVNIVFEQLARSEMLAQAAKQPIKWNPDWKAIVDHRDGTVDEQSTNCIFRAVAV
jgi:hypothetical protein